MEKKSGSLCLIKADFREDISGIGELLERKYKVGVVREQLKTGDYIIHGEIVVERKTSLDFVRSLIDGRIFRQAANMKRFFDSAFFIVEGNNLYNTGIDIHPHAVKGALVSIALRWQIPVLFSENTGETALFLWLVANQKVTAYNELSVRPGRRPKRLYKKQLYILQGFPQVGPKLAGELLSHFGSVEAVITASEEDLTEVKGLGKKKAGQIKKLVSN